MLAFVSSVRSPLTSSSLVAPYVYMGNFLVLKDSNQIFRNDVVWLNYHLSFYAYSNPPVAWGISIQPTFALVRVVRGD